MRPRFFLLQGILFCFILLSCNNKIDNILKADEYKSTVKIIGDSNNIKNLLLENLYVKTESSPLKNIIRYSTTKSLNNFDSNLIEIEFTLLEYDSRTNISPPLFIKKQVFIGIRKYDNNMKGYFIIGNFQYPEDYSNNSRFLVNGNIKDSVITNLEYSSLKKLFPFFNGKYKYHHCDTISINCNYSISSDEFYKFIKFDGERLGLPIFIIDQRKIISDFPIL